MYVACGVGMVSPIVPLGVDRTGPGTGEIDRVPGVMTVSVHGHELRLVLVGESTV